MTPRCFASDIMCVVGHMTETCFSAVAIDLVKSSKDEFSELP